MRSTLEPERSGLLRKVLMRDLIAVATLAFILRAVFVFAVVRVTANAERPLEGSDSPEYLHLATNIAARGQYVINTMFTRA